MEQAIIEAIQRKGNFLFELSWDSDFLSGLTDEEFGKIMRGVIKCVKTGETECFEDRAMNMIIKSMIRSIQNSTSAYIKRCDVNAKNAAKGGKAKTEKQRSEPPDDVSFRMECEKIRADKQGIPP